MESKLALYQLAAPQLGGCTSCRSAMSVPIKQWNYSFDNIMNRFTQLVGAAGSVNNLINAGHLGNYRVGALRNIILDGRGDHNAN